VGLAGEVNAANYHPDTNDVVETADPLAFKALSTGSSGSWSQQSLVLWVISLRGEIIAGNSLNGLLPVVVVVVALCAFIGLLNAYVQFHQATSILLQSGTAGINSQHERRW
jgi:hypothetical protein